MKNPQEESKYTTSNLDNDKYKDYSVSKEELNYNMKQEIIAEMEKQETLEEAAESYDAKQTILDFGKPYTSTSRPYAKAFIEGAKWQKEQILQFLYSEITERRPYSSSKMCEKVIEFIEQFKK